MQKILQLLFFLLLFWTVSAKQNRRSKKEQILRKLIDQIGNKVGKWHEVDEITEVLGEGSFGRVCKGLWMGTEVAIKEIKLDDDDGDPIPLTTRMKIEWLEEALLQLTLSHPRTVPLYSVIMDDSVPDRAPLALVMDLMQGNGTEVMRKWQNHGRLGPQDRLRISIDLFQALAFIHSRGVVHADIKLYNLMIDSLGHGRLVDFGLSRHSLLPVEHKYDTTHIPKSMNIPLSPDPILRRRQSELQSRETGAYRGTKRWMAPEVIAGYPPTRASDVYSAAITLWEIWTKVPGVTPYCDYYKGPWEYECWGSDYTLRAVLEGARPSWDALDAYTSEVVKIVMQHSWHNDRRLRPTAADAAWVLMELREHGRQFTPADAEEFFRMRLHSRQALERFFRNESQFLRMYWSTQKEGRYPDHERVYRQEHGDYNEEDYEDGHESYGFFSTKDPMDNIPRPRIPGRVEYADPGEGYYSAVYSRGVDGDLYMETYMYSGNSYPPLLYESSGSMDVETLYPDAVPTAYLDFFDPYERDEEEGEEDSFTSGREVLGVYACPLDGLIYTLQVETSPEDSDSMDNRHGTTKDNVSQPLHLRVFDSDGVFISSTALPQLQGLRYTVLSAALHPQCDSLLLSIQIQPSKRIWRASEYQYAQLNESYGLLKLSFHWESNTPLGGVYHEDMESAMHSFIVTNYPRRLAAHLVPRAQHPYLAHLVRKRMFQKHLPRPLLTLSYPGFKSPFPIHQMPDQPVREHLVTGSNVQESSILHHQPLSDFQEHGRLVFSDPHPIGYTLLPLSLPQPLHTGNGSSRLHTQLVAGYDTGPTGSATVHLAGAMVSPDGDVRTFTHAVLDTPISAAPGHTMIALKDTFCQAEDRDAIGFRRKKGPGHMPSCENIRYLTMIPMGNVIGALVDTGQEIQLQIIQRGYQPLEGYTLEHAKSIPVPFLRNETNRQRKGEKQDITGFTAFADIPELTRDYGFAVSFEDVILLFDTTANLIGSIEEPVRDIVWNAASKEFVGVVPDEEVSSGIAFRKIRIDIDALVH